MKEMCTCKECGKKYDRNRLIASLGGTSNPVVLGLCSTKCYTDRTLRIKEATLTRQIHIAMQTDMSTVSTIADLLEKRRIEITSLYEMCKQHNIPIEKERAKFVHNLEYYNNALRDLILGKPIPTD